jgi:hypothetical protein
MKAWDFDHRLIKYEGVTGITTLNKIGDRAEGQYDYWKVTAKAGEGNSQAFNWNNTTN